MVPEPGGLALPLAIWPDRFAAQAPALPKLAGPGRRSRGRLLSGRAAVLGAGALIAAVIVGVQETYLRAWAAFGSFRGGNVRAWLAAICRNAARSQADLAARRY